MSNSILTRRFVSDDQAEPAKRQHRKPCADCPFARTALKGWLGNPSLEDWVQMVHGEHYINCHCTTNRSCAGAAIFRANVLKICRDPKHLRLPPNKTLVFASTQEFVKHHTE